MPCRVPRINYWGTCIECAACGWAADFIGDGVGLRKKAGARLPSLHAIDAMIVHCSSEGHSGG